MTQFVIRRFLLILPVLLGILLITFAIARAIPGDPCYIALGERATEAQCNAYRERMGLNDSILVQFVRYLGGLARGDLGESLRTGRAVSLTLAERLPMTVELTIGATLFASFFGVSLGLVAALRRNSWPDVVTMIGANVGISMPVYWLGMLLAYVFALLLRDTPFFIPPSGRLTSGLSITPLAQYWNLGELSGLPQFVISLLTNSAIFNAIITGNWTMLRDAVWHLILPSVAVGTIPLAIIARITRSSLLDVLGQDYVRTARAKGASARRTLFKHALRNALVPIMTIIGLEVGALLGGAVLTETIFGLPGMGTWMVQSILARDYAVVQAGTVVIALIYVTVNFLVDLSYGFLDPRVRLE